MPRPSNVDVRNAFEDIPSAAGSRCQRVRCRHCKDIRAKNTTRQIAHLQFKCDEFKKSEDYKRSSLIDIDNQYSPDQTTDTPSVPTASTKTSAIWSGKQPNPDLQVTRRPSTKRNRDGSTKDTSALPHSTLSATTPLKTSQLAPSLTSRLERQATPLSVVSQQPFLASAGAGTLDLEVMNQWIAQHAYVSRAYIGFIGSLLAKVRIPIMPNSQAHPTYRTVFALQAILNNAVGQMNIVETSLPISSALPSPVTKAYLDLLHATAAPNASLLEGLVVLWVTEHCNLASWRYATSYRQSYALFNAQLPAHIAVLHQSLMPVWTSDHFVQLVDTCRRLVDEFANAQTAGNGREEMTRCETSYKQVVWLWSQMWPDRARSNHNQNHELGHGTGQRHDHEDLNHHSMSNGARANELPGNGTTHDVDADADGDDDDEVTHAGRNSIGGPAHMSYYGVGHATGQSMNTTR